MLGGTPLFRLVQHAQAANWFARLGEAGILVRPFPAQPQWLRFGIPQEEQDFMRLAKILSEAWG